MAYKSKNTFYIDDEKLLERLLNLTMHHHYTPRKLECQLYNDALVQPFLIHKGKFGGGVLTSDGHQIFNTGYHEYIHEPYEFDTDKVKICHEKVIYIGCIYQCWGHLFTDGFAKLWYLETEECQQLIEGGVKVVYITKNNAPLASFVYELFDIAGVDLRKFEHVTEHIRFDGVYIPDNSFYLQLEPYERMFTAEYLSLIERICDKFISCGKDYPQKIYFSRTRLYQNKRDYGEKQIEKCMRKAGYTIVYPEQHTVKEQIIMLSHCKSFAATEGSVSLNSIFCQPCTKLLVIKKGAYTNGYQAAVADARSLDVTYVEGYKSSFNNKQTPWVGPFFIYPNKNICKALNLSYEKKLFLNKEWYRYIYDHNPLMKIVKKIIR